MVLFGLIGLILFAILMFNITQIGDKLIAIHIKNKETRPYFDKECIDKKINLSDSLVIAEIKTDKPSIYVKIIRNADPKKRDYICTLLRKPLRMKGNRKILCLSNGYHLENKGKDIVLHYDFFSIEEFDFFKKNIDSAYIELSVLAE